MKAMQTPYEELLRSRGYSVTRIVRTHLMDPGLYGGRVRITFCDQHGQQHAVVIEADTKHGRIIVLPD